MAESRMHLWNGSQNRLISRGSLWDKIDSSEGRIGTVQFGCTLEMQVGNLQKDSHVGQDITSRVAMVYCPTPRRLSKCMPKQEGRRGHQ